MMKTKIRFPLFSFFTDYHKDKGLTSDILCATFILNYITLFNQVGNNALLNMQIIITDRKMIVSLNYW